MIVGKGVGQVGVGRYKRDLDLVLVELLDVGDRLQRAGAARLGAPAQVQRVNRVVGGEFLAVSDLADACVFVMKNYSDVGFLNVGSGQEITIADFARLVAEVVGYRGQVVFDPSRPDGMPRKLLDISKLTALGWRAKTSLPDGLRQTYADFLLRNAPSALQSIQSPGSQSVLIEGR